MRLDLLDILYRTERALGVKLSERKIAAVLSRRQPPDLSAGQWYDLVRAAWEKRPPAKRCCMRCGYPRFGLPQTSVCPECGTPSPDDPAVMWSQLRVILAHSIGCRAEAIGRESMLQRDLASLGSDASSG